MTSRQRLITALEGGVPDRLPATTHHLMPGFLAKELGDLSPQEFFDRFGLDAITWIQGTMPDSTRGDYLDPGPPAAGELQSQRIVSESWRITEERLSDVEFRTTRYSINTPHKTLTMILQADSNTDWVSEPLLKEKSDIETFERFAPAPLCDVEAVNREATRFGERGIVRGAVPGFDIYGQPGCWQDAAVLTGIERLILETFSDPQWVHTLLEILFERKRRFIASSVGARFDIIELGGGSASTTVISPAIFDDFTAPYDARLIAAAHEYGQRIVYHTCGGMMPILESIERMRPDAMETFTPPEMGGDADLAEAKQRVGSNVCMIGGFDQYHLLKNCDQEVTRRAVRECFAAAGGNGGYILAPSDHFFEADIPCLEAFADEAKKCIY